MYKTADSQDLKLKRGSKCFI